jgi:hypothetical protein
MSIATASLEIPTLQAKCNHIVDQTERLFGQYSITDRTKRLNQLQDILWRTIQFKQKLECQEGTYMLWRSHSKTPFRKERMCSLTKATDPDEWVELSLWPGLYKTNPSGDWCVIEKEIVKTSSHSDFLIDCSDDLDFQQGEEEEF